MTVDVVPGHDLLRRGAERLTKTAILMQEDPDSFFEERVRPGLSEVDLRIVEEVTIRHGLTKSYAEALHVSPDGLQVSAHGWFDDVLAFRRSWGFDPCAITVPTLLWHGGQDAFSPVSHTPWLGSRIRSSEVRVEADLGHFGAMEVLPRVLSWVVARHVEAVGREAGLPPSSGIVQGEVVKVIDSEG